MHIDQAGTLWHRPPQKRLSGPALIRSPRNADPATPRPTAGPLVIARSAMIRARTGAGAKSCKRVTLDAPAIVDAQTWTPTSKKTCQGVAAKGNKQMNGSEAAKDAQMTR